MASPNLTEIVTVAIRNRRKYVTDNVSENIALLDRLMKKGNIDPFDGGQNIVEELEYAENQTYTRYSGYEEINISPSTVFTAAEYTIRQVAITVSMSGLEKLQNAGKSRQIPLMKKRIKNAERSFKNNFSADVYSDGSASNQVDGLQAAVPDDPTTGSYGGIDRATWSFWRPTVKDATTDFGAAATSANIRSYMVRTWQPVCRNGDKPDLIIADDEYWRLYEESLHAIQRISSAEKAESGPSTLKFFDADVVFDGGYGGDAPSNHMWFLNTDFIRLRPHKDRNYTPIGGKRESINQDAELVISGWAGNLTTSNSFVHALLKD